MTSGKIRVDGGTIQRKSRGIYNEKSGVTSGSMDIIVHACEGSDTNSTEGAVGIICSESTKDIIYTVEYRKDYEDFWPHIALYDTISCTLKVKHAKVAKKNVAVKRKKRQKASNSDSSSNESVKIAKPDVVKARITGNPFVTRAQNVKDVTINAMIAASRIKIDTKGKGQSGNSLSLSVKQLVILYHYILEHKVLQQHPFREPGVLIANVDEYLTMKAHLYQTGDRTGFMQDFLEQYTYAVDLEPKGIATLLKKWYYTNDLRLLKLIGVTSGQKDSELDWSGMPPGELYYRILENPMYVHCLRDYDRMKFLSKLLRIDVSNLDKKCGRVLVQLSKCTARGDSVYADSISFRDRNGVDDEVYDKIQDFVCISTGGRLYLRELYYMEKNVAKAYATLLTQNKYLTYDANLLKLPDPHSGIIPDDEQCKAVTTAFKTGVTIITGPAGTGKTTTIQKAIQIFEASKIPFSCTSFTGKATARIEECCKVSTTNMDTMILKREEYAHVKNMIIDEISMISLNLMYRFFNAFPTLERLILVGDPKQIEPIGYGNVLGELMDSNTIPICELKKIYRVKTETGVVDKIIKNSTLISHWKGSEETYQFEEGDNFIVKDGGDVGTIKNEIDKMYEDGITPDKFILITPYNDNNKNNQKVIQRINDYVQYIYNGGNKSICRKAREVGETGLNRQWTKLKSYANKKGIVTKSARKEWLKDSKGSDLVYCVGDLVMCTKNNHFFNTHNGQEGVIKDVNVNEGITVKFNNGNEVVFGLNRGKKVMEDNENDTNGGASFGDVNDIILAYAVTVHKMQGGQRDIVIYYLEIWSNFITRAITYTAITRASKKVVLIGVLDLFCKSILNVNIRRKDSLRLQLRDFLPQDYTIECGNEMERAIAAAQLKVNEAYEAAFGSGSENYSGEENVGSGSCGGGSGSGSGSYAEGSEEIEIEIVDGSGSYGF